MFDRRQRLKFSAYSTKKISTFRSIALFRYKTSPLYPKSKKHHHDQCSRAFTSSTPFSLLFSLSQTARETNFTWSLQNARRFMLQDRIKNARKISSCDNTEKSLEIFVYVNCFLHAIYGVFTVPQACDSSAYSPLYGSWIFVWLRAEAHNAVRKRGTGRLFVHV